ncbi:MAG: DivIVA domain-containing protein [Gaiellaceae bacterium]
MPIRPEDIDPSKLPVALRGYDREATDELLKRVAWDYRQALRAHEERAENDRRLAARIEELEARLASQHDEFASAMAGRDARVDTDAARQIASLEAEVALVRRKLQAHESRAELTRVLLQTAQKAAREIRESARQDALAALRAAHRRAVKIEHDATASARHSVDEIERLRRLESDLRDRLRHTLQAVIGENGSSSDGEPEQPPEPQRDVQNDTWSSFDSH